MVGKNTKKGERGHPTLPFYVENAVFMLLLSFLPELQIRSACLRDLP